MELSETDSPAGVAGIILAAGAAERMGKPKQLLSYRGLPLVQHAVDAAEASLLDPIVVVTGAFADQVEQALGLKRAVIVRNPDFRRGNMSSLECGAEQVPQAEAIVLLMGDHPSVNVAVIDQMIRSWKTDRPWGAVADYTDRIAHPFLLSRAALDEAVTTGGPKLLWRLLGEDQTGRVKRLRVDHPAPLDINTPADYKHLVAESD